MKCKEKINYLYVSHHIILYSLVPYGTFILRSDVWAGRRSSLSSPAGAFQCFLLSKICFQLPKMLMLVCKTSPKVEKLARPWPRGAVTQARIPPPESPSSSQSLLLTRGDGLQAPRWGRARTGLAPRCLAALHPLDVCTDGPEASGRAALYANLKSVGGRC